MEESNSSAGEPASRVANASLVFSVVIPTHGRPAALERCLERLAAQDYPRDRFEVVVVDDGSRPPVSIEPARLQGLRFTLIRQERTGPAGARNRGAREAEGRYLAFLDDDCLPEPGWLAALESAFRRLEGRRVLLGGKIVNPHRENVNAEMAEAILGVLLERYRPEPGGVYFFRSMNLAAVTREFLALGGFDQRFSTAEDRELCDRWLQEGGELVAAPEAVISHASELTFPGFLGRHFRYGRGAFRFHALRRRRGSGRLGPSVLGFYAAVLASCFQPPARRVVPRVLLVLSWQVCNVLGFAAELASRRGRAS